MKRHKNWKWKRSMFINGCNSVALASWRALPDFLLNHGYIYPYYIFRGHTHTSYELSSPLTRHFRNMLNHDKDKYLANFKLAIRGRLGLAEDRFLSDKELWLVGQEHGLKTPLLEWTQTPYVAAFFAFYPERRFTISPDATTKDIRRAEKSFIESRSIYLLNRSAIEEYRKKFRLSYVRKTYPKLYEKLKELAGNLVSLNDPYYLDRYIDRILTGNNKKSYSTKLISACDIATTTRDYYIIDIIPPTSLHNPRFITQGSLFTLGPVELTLEEWVKANFSGDAEILIKINIPDQDRAECLQTLNQMNINNLNLFPDLSGAATYCNDVLDGLYPEDQG